MNEVQPDLMLHQEVIIDNNTYLFKVPGGWIYKFYTYKVKEENWELVSTCFVPEPEVKIL